MDIFTSAKGKAPGVEPIEEAELKLAEADVAPVPARRGRPRGFPAGTSKDLVRYYGRMRVLPAGAETPLGRLPGMRLMVWPRDAAPGDQRQLFFPASDH